MSSPSKQAFINSDFHTMKGSTYFEVYDHLFSRFRGKNITFIEIGVASGGGLFMWREFFGHNARIIGIDLNPDAKKWEDYGFEIFIGDQGDEDFWKEIKSKIKSIDIVLDDGGHTYVQQIVTVESLLDSINDGGILVVEDTHSSYQGGFGRKRYSFINYIKLLINKINYRFYGLDPSNAEYRFWSIEIFESIVAFQIKRYATKVKSEPLNNNRLVDVKSIDFRYNGTLAWYFIKICNYIKSVDVIRKIAKKPLIKKIYARSVENIGNLTGSSAKIKKYFK